MKFMHTRYHNFYVWCTVANATDYGTSPLRIFVSLEPSMLPTDTMQATEVAYWSRRGHLYADMAFFQKNFSAASGPLA